MNEQNLNGDYVSFEKNYVRCYDIFNRTRQDHKSHRGKGGLISKLILRVNRDTLKGLRKTMQDIRACKELRQNTKGIYVQLNNPEENA